MLKSLWPWAVGFASWSFPTEDCGGGAPTRLSPSLVVVLRLSAFVRAPMLSQSEAGFLLGWIGVRPRSGIRDAAVKGLSPFEAV